MVIKYCLKFWHMRDVKKINLTYWGVAIGVLITSFLIDIPEKK